MVETEPDWIHEKPPFDFRKPTTRDVKKYAGKNLLNLYVREFEERCWGSPQFAEATLHAIIGQLNGVRDRYIYIGKNKMDLRIHMLLLQPSGTGKSQGFNFVSEIVEYGLGLKVAYPAKITDAKLLGSVRQEKDKNIPVLGLLDPQSGYRYIMQDEGTLVFDTKTTEHNKDMITYYTKAMDCIGRNAIENHNIMIGNDPVKIYPSASLILTSYPPSNLPVLLQRGGFFPRLLLLYNPKEWRGFERDLAQLCNNMLPPPEEKKTEEPVGDVQTIVTVLKAIQYHYTTFRDKPITYSPSLGRRSDNIEEIMRENNVLWYIIKEDIYKPISRLNPLMREVMRPFATRMAVRLSILAHHYTIMRFGWRVEKKDILDARNTLIEPWKRLIYYVESNQEMITPELKRWLNKKQVADRVYATLNKKYKEKEGWVPYTEFVELAMKGWRVTKSTAQNYVEEFCNNQYYEIKPAHPFKALKGKAKRAIKPL